MLIGDFAQLGRPMIVGKFKTRLATSLRNMINETLDMSITIHRIIKQGE